MADDIKVAKREEPQVAGAGLKAKEEQKFSAIGEIVRGYVLNFKEYMPPLDKKPELNKFEEGVIAATTGWSVPGVKGAELYTFPFAGKNRLRIDFEGDANLPGGTHPQALVAFGSNQPTINKLGLYKERLVGGKVHTFEEYGLLDERTSRGASKLGKSNPTGPLLDDLSIGVGTNGGIGVRGKATDGSLSWDVQVAQKSDSAMFPDPTKTGPTKMLSVSKSGMLEGLGGQDKYVVGATAFTGITGPKIHGEINKPGIDITAVGQRKFGEDTTLNVIAEGMNVKGAAQAKILGLELSKQLKGGLIPYAGVSYTKASGMGLPDGIPQDRTNEAKLGVAIQLSREASGDKKFSGFCEVQAGTNVKPSFFCGFGTGVVAGEIMHSGGKRK